MDIDLFWQLIGDRPAAAPQDRKAREQLLHEQLVTLPPAAIAGFQAHLDHACVRADTDDVYEAARRAFRGRLTDDGYEYFRLWLVGCGREAFEAVLADAGALAGLPGIQRLAGREGRDWEPEEWPDWETLDYVAERAYGQAIGEDDEDLVEEAFRAAVEEAEVGPPADGR